MQQTAPRSDVEGQERGPIGSTSSRSSSVCGCTNGAPWIRLVEACRMEQPSRLARPGLSIATWTEVFFICTWSCWSCTREAGQAKRPDRRPGRKVGSGARVCCPGHTRRSAAGARA
jgi:hypothetical protein